MKITFTQTQRISEDGFGFRVCSPGETLDIAEVAAIEALRRGYAVRAITNPATLLAMGESL